MFSKMSIVLVVAFLVTGSSGFALAGGGIYGWDDDPCWVDEVFICGAPPVSAIDRLVQDPDWTPIPFLPESELEAPFGTFCRGDGAPDPLPQNPTSTLPDLWRPGAGISSPESPPERSALSRLQWENENRPCPDCPCGLPYRPYPIPATQMPEPWYQLQ